MTRRPPAWQALQRLQERRDKLFRSMREDLDSAFKSAHAEVASVIRDLQRGGSAQQAALARQRIPVFKLNQYLMAQVHVAENEVHHRWEEDNVRMLAQYVS